MTKKNPRIRTFRGELSVYKRKLVLYINEKPIDISHLLPAWVFKVGVEDAMHPTINWKIKKEMSKVAKLYMMKNYPEFPHKRIFT